MNDELGSPAAKFVTLNRIVELWWSPLHHVLGLGGIVGELRKAEGRENLHAPRCSIVERGASEFAQEGGFVSDFPG
jgi:hypothetical protein